MRATIVIFMWPPAVFLVLFWSPSRPTPLHGGEPGVPPGGGLHLFRVFIFGVAPAYEIFNFLREISRIMFFLDALVASLLIEFIMTAVVASRFSQGVPAFLEPLLVSLHKKAT